MNRTSHFTLGFMAFIITSAPLIAQIQKSTKQSPDELDTFVREYMAAAQVNAKPTISTVERTPASSPGCKNLNTIGDLIDGAFAGQKNETRMIKPLLADSEDALWDELTDCANETKTPSRRAEALRVSALWEKLRGEALQAKYQTSIPVSVPSCRDLDKLYAIVKAAQNSSDSDPVDSRGVAVRKRLIDCANDSYRLNESRARSEETDAAEYLSAWAERNQKFLVAKHNSLITEYNQLLGEANDLAAKYNLLSEDYEKLSVLAHQAINANDSYVRSLERVALFQSVQASPVRCTGASYSYGKWGTFNMECQ